MEMINEGIQQAQENLADLKKRGRAAIGGDALAFMDTLLSPEEIAQSDLRVAIIGELIKARMEKGYTSPQIDTLLKVLAPLGKTLAVVPLNGAK